MKILKKIFVGCDEQKDCEFGDAKLTKNDKLAIAQLQSSRKQRVG